MKMDKWMTAAALSAAITVAEAGDLTVEGALNVTSNLAARTLSVTNAAVGALVVEGPAVFAGPLAGDGSHLTGITGTNMVSGSIGSAALATGAVTAASIANGAVTSSKIAAGSVGIDKVVLADWDAWGDGRYFSSTGTSDLVMTPGRIAAGYGLNLSNIASTAHGAVQSGYNSGAQKIATNAYGASQCGYNTGRQTIGMTAYGSSQSGSNMGTQAISLARGALQSGHNMGSQAVGLGAHGAEQRGYNLGTMNIGNAAYGAEQRGYILNGAGATNSGKGSVQLLCLTNMQTALITGHASIGMGACRVTDNQALVAGDGLVSHGNGTVTAYGFYGDGSGLTNLTAASMAPGSIGSVALAAGAVGPSQIADGGVNSAKIQDGAIADADVAADARISQTKVEGLTNALSSLYPSSNPSNYVSSSDVPDIVADLLAGFNPGACVQTNQTGDVAINGTLSAVAFTGNGSALTNLNLAAYVGSNLVWDAASNKLHAAASGSVYTDADAVAAVTGNSVDMSGHSITGLADATADTDAVNRQTVTNLIQQALLHVGPFGNLSMGAFTAQ